MNLIRLALAFHNHQPIGNFDGTIEECYQKSYRPFLELVSRPAYSALRFSIHNSGCLEEWLDRHHPEYLDQLAELAQSGRVEILGGPMQEPILAMLPSRDRVGQILAHTRWIENRLGVKVRGMWMPERVWEPSYVRDLTQAGMEFTVLDDYHFKKAGLLEEKLYGYYLTEDAGALMAVYPDSEKLRYWIPFDSVERSVNYLREIAEKQADAVLFCADDGEKFGAWPQTFEHVYGGGQWLARFFDTLVQNVDWLKTVTMSEALEETKPLGKCYLPDCSYREMTEWALDTESRKRLERGMNAVPEEVGAWEKICESFSKNARVEWSITEKTESATENVIEKETEIGTEKVSVSVTDPEMEIKAETERSEKFFWKPDWVGFRMLKGFATGGNWRNFKVKYPETNEMYCRMLAVSGRLATLENELLRKSKTLSAAEYYRKTQYLEAARAELYRGQCNCPYWHGAFGGVYLPHLRNAIFRHLISADKLLDAVAENTETHGDFNLDGNAEYRLETPELSVWVAPQAGGMLYELDVRKTELNLLATLARRPEPYHEPMVRAIEAQKREETRRLAEAQGIKTDAEVISEDLGNIRDRALFKQEGLEERLQYDLGVRKAFHDGFYGPDVTAEGLYSGEKCVDRMFYDRTYQAELVDGALTLAATGTVYSFEGNPHQITICKTVKPVGDTLEMTWRLGNLPRWETLLFGVEFNFAGLPGHCDDRYFLDADGNRLGDLSACLNTKASMFLGLVDEWQKLRVTLEVSRITDFWTYPVETVSNSEGGFELVHQAVCVIPHWYIRTENDSVWECRMNLKCASGK
ncbi:MAG: DUF1926 domain-containing protein [Planctomycetia bacterium]|nr:DUF1926 domain-containing protein [Planctomycetia bacterium]